MTDDTTDQAAQAVIHYHLQSYHRLSGYARGPQTLDWDNQPSPFRHYRGAAALPLPRLRSAPTVSWRDIHQPAQQPATLTLTNLAGLLQLSMGLSAWKQYGPSRWSLRHNPSSGNLHPTETYVLSHQLSDLTDGVWHYNVEHHELEQRLGTAVLTSEQPALLIGLSSVHWREAWKYGERAFRYCQLDVGHALGALRYAAALYGWRLRLLDAPDDVIRTLLGLDHGRHDDPLYHEHPDCLLQLLTQPVTAESASPDYCLTTKGWRGEANALGGEPRCHWQAIDEVVAASHRRSDGHSVPSDSLAAAGQPIKTTSANTAATLIQRRRSAQTYDGQTSISTAQLGQLINALRQPSVLPMDVWPDTVAIHPIVFIHRVEGLRPGLYALPRSEAGRSLLQAELRPEFLWESIELQEGCRIEALVYANARNAARTLACHQAIAGDSVLSLAMLADFEHRISVDPSAYRRLFWEAGLLGQQCYLQAEALGLQGTGIGCFFDESIHETLGIKTIRLQSMYHFTIGKGVFDDRILSLPGYTATRA